MSDGALKAASLGSTNVAPLSAPFGSFGRTAIHLPRLAEARMARVENLAGEPVGHDQGPTLPIRVAMACFQNIALPVQPHLPSPHTTPILAGAAAFDPFFAKRSTTCHVGAAFPPCDPSAAVSSTVAGQMQRVPVYRLTFASIRMVAFDHRTMSCRYTRRQLNSVGHREGSASRSATGIPFLPLPPGGYRCPTLTMKRPRFLLHLQRRSRLAATPCGVSVTGRGYCRHGLRQQGKVAEGNIFAFFLRRENKKTLTKKTYDFALRRSRFSILSHKGRGKDAAPLCFLSALLKRFRRCLVTSSPPVGEDRKSRSSRSEVLDFLG